MSIASWVFEQWASACSDVSGSGKPGPGPRIRKVVLAFSAAALVLIGAPVTAAEQWAQGSPQFVYPLSDGNFIVGFQVSSASCSASGNPKYLYISVGQNGVTASGAKNIYAAALLALGSGRMVDVAFDDGTTYCYSNRMSVRQ